MNQEPLTIHNDVTWLADDVTKKNYVPFLNKFSHKHSKVLVKFHLVQIELLHRLLELISAFLFIPVFTEPWSRKRGFVSLRE